MSGDLTATTRTRQLGERDRQLMAAVARGEVVSQRMDMPTTPAESGWWVALWRHSADDAPVTRRVQARVQRLERLGLATCRDTARSDVRAVEPTPLGRALLADRNGPAESGEVAA